MVKELLAMAREAIGVEVVRVVAGIWRYDYYTISFTCYHNYSLQASVSTTPGQTGLAARKENLPGMFSFHQNSAKAYLRTSM